MNGTPFTDLSILAHYLRERIKKKKYILLFAFNGTGKTRLSMAFKELGKQGDGEEQVRDTLYFNAFTEDLFYWDNDLKEDSERVLLLNTGSHFFNGLYELEMENRIRPLLHRYSDFDFIIDYDKGAIKFFRERDKYDEQAPVPIKVSRGEENLFVWCFFLAIAELATDEQEAYSWVKYIYVDDPISSLDDNHAIAVAAHLANLLKRKDNKVKAVISSHHHLFFNVMWNEMKREKGLNFHLSVAGDEPGYVLKNTGDTPQFHHVAMLQHLYEIAATDDIRTYHFTMLRNVLERTATFFGYKGFSACIPNTTDDPDNIVHDRMINILSHGNYSHFEPKEMNEENKQHFRTILNSFMQTYRFNPELFLALKETQE